MGKSSDTPAQKPKSPRKGRGDTSPGDTWTVRGVAPETREAAKVAARRAGMTAGAWIDQALRKAAVETIQGGSHPPPAPRVEELLERLVRQVEETNAGRARDREELARLREDVERDRRRGFWARLFGRDASPEKKAMDAP